MKLIGLFYVVWKNRSLWPYIIWLGILVMKVFKSYHSSCHGGSILPIRIIGISVGKFRKIGSLCRIQLNIFFEDLWYFCFSKFLSYFVGLTFPFHHHNLVQVHTDHIQIRIIASNIFTENQGFYKRGPSF